MNDIRAVADRSDHAVAAPRRGAYARVRDLLQGDAYPANVYEVADKVGVEVSFRFKVLQANRHPKTGAGRRPAAWDYRVGYHPALYIQADDVRGEAAPSSQIGGTVLVPVWGWIKAGPPDQGDEAFDNAFLLDKGPIGDGTFFMLKVLGDSMINAGIADGDWVVVHQQEDAKNGEIVAAVAGEGVTVKTLHREPGVLELVPHNPNYEPIQVTELSLLGVVVGVVRQD